MSETSATSIWRNLYFQKYQVLHWLLWQQLYLEIKCSISSPKLINQQNHSSSPGDGYKKRQREDKSVLFFFSPILFQKFLPLQDTKSWGRKVFPQNFDYRVTRHSGQLGTVSFYILSSIDYWQCCLLILKTAPIQTINYMDTLHVQQLPYLYSGDT